MTSTRGDYHVQEFVHQFGRGQLEFLGSLLAVEGPRRQGGFPLLVHLIRCPVSTHHVEHLLPHRRLGWAGGAAQDRQRFALWERGTSTQT